MLHDGKFFPKVSRRGLAWLTRVVTVVSYGSLLPLVELVVIPAKKLLNCLGVRCCEL
jgi:hypothetical protein